MYGFLQKQLGKRVSELDAYEFSHFSAKKGKMVNDKVQENLVIFVGSNFII